MSSCSTTAWSTLSPLLLRQIFPLERGTARLRIDRSLCPRSEPTDHGVQGRGEREPLLLPARGRHRVVLCRGIGHFCLGFHQYSRVRLRARSLHSGLCVSVHTPTYTAKLCRVRQRQLKCMRMMGICLDVAPHIYVDMCLCWQE